MAQQWVEKTGRSYQDAVRSALEELQLTEDQVIVEVLEDRARGFFGLGPRFVRVRVTPKESKPPVVEETPPSKEGQELTELVEGESPDLEEGGEEEGLVEVLSGPEEEVPVIQPTPEHLKKAVEVLQNILDRMGLEVRARSDRIAGQYIHLHIVGRDAALVIGKKAQTLNALQYLLGVILSRREGGKVRVVLDAEGYRERRARFLRRQALRIARQVRSTGQEAVLEALSAAERRIIHLALANEPGVYTYSEGEEPNRRVVISPLE